MCVEIRAKRCHRVDVRTLTTDAKPASDQSRGSYEAFACRTDSGDGQSRSRCCRCCCYWLSFLPPVSASPANHKYYRITWATIITFCSSRSLSAALRALSSRLRANCESGTGLKVRSVLAHELKSPRFQCFRNLRQEQQVRRERVPEEKTDIAA